MITNTENKNSGLYLFQTRVLERLDDPTLYAHIELEAVNKSRKFSPIFFNVELDSLTLEPDFGKTFFVACIHKAKLDYPNYLERVKRRVKSRAKHVLKNLGKGNFSDFDLDSIDSLIFGHTDANRNLCGYMLPWDLSDETVKDLCEIVSQQERQFYLVNGQEDVVYAMSNQWVLDNWPVKNVFTNLRAGRTPMSPRERRLANKAKADSMAKDLFKSLGWD